MKPNALEGIASALVLVVIVAMVLSVEPRVGSHLLQVGQAIGFGQAPLLLLILVAAMLVLALLRL